MAQNTAAMQKSLTQLKAENENLKSRSEMQDFIEEFVFKNQKRKSQDSSIIRLDIDVKLAMLELAPTLETFVEAGDFSILPHALAEPKHVADLARHHLSKTKIKFKGDREVFEAIRVVHHREKGHFFPTMSLDCHHT
jgi:hypothetical protein